MAQESAFLPTHHEACSYHDYDEATKDRHPDCGGGGISYVATPRISHDMLTDKREHGKLDLDPGKPDGSATIYSEQCTAVDNNSRTCPFT